MLESNNARRPRVPVKLAGDVNCLRLRPRRQQRKVISRKNRLLNSEALQPSASGWLRALREGEDKHSVCPSRASSAPFSSRAIPDSSRAIPTGEFSNILRSATVRGLQSHLKYCSPSLASSRSTSNNISEMLSKVFGKVFDHLLAIVFYFSTRLSFRCRRGRRCCRLSCKVLVCKTQQIHTHIHG